MLIVLMIYGLLLICSIFMFSLLLIHKTLIKNPYYCPVIIYVKQFEREKRRSWNLEYVFPVVSRWESALCVPVTFSQFLCSLATVHNSSMLKLRSWLKIQTVPEYSVCCVWFTFGQNIHFIHVFRFFFFLLNAHLQKYEVGYFNKNKSSHTKTKNHAAIQYSENHTHLFNQAFRIKEKKDHLFNCSHSTFYTKFNFKYFIFPKQFQILWSETKINSTFCRSTIMEFPQSTHIGDYWLDQQKFICIRCQTCFAAIEWNIHRNDVGAIQIDANPIRFWV